jgi:AraC-like DNA-binding protein
MGAKINPASPELREIFKQHLLDTGAKFNKTDSVRISFGISRAEATEIYQEVKDERKRRKAEHDERIAAATAYAARHTIGRFRLAERFEISGNAAKAICAAEYARREDTRSKLRANKKADEAIAFEYVKKVATFASVESIADRFGMTIEWTAAAFDQVLGRRSKDKPTRTVRRFVDLSGTDATADRVRYPSGIGFGVVEVVR